MPLSAHISGIQAQWISGSEQIFIWLLLYDSIWFSISLHQVIHYICHSLNFRLISGLSYIIQVYNMSNLIIQNISHIFIYCSDLCRCSVYILYVYPTFVKISNFNDMSFFYCSDFCYISDIHTMDNSVHWLDIRFEYMIQVYNMSYFEYSKHQPYFFIYCSDLCRCSLYIPCISDFCLDLEF